MRLCSCWLARFADLWRYTLQCAVRISSISQQFLFNLQVALVVKNVFPIILEKNIRQWSEGNSKGLHSMTQLEEQARFIADGFLLCLIIQGTQWSKSRNSKLQSLQELKNLGKFFFSFSWVWNTSIRLYAYTHTCLCDSVSMWEAKNLSTGSKLGSLLTEREWKLNKVWWKLSFCNQSLVCDALALMLAPCLAHRNSVLLA